MIAEDFQPAKDRCPRCGMKDGRGIMAADPNAKIPRHLVPWVIVFITAFVVVLVTLHA